MNKNLILDTDSYKLSHYRQYPANTEYVFSYIESRGGQFDQTLFFGLQKALLELNQWFPTLEDLAEARYVAEHHGVPFNEDGWRELIELGYFPLEIRAVPEGSSVATQNILVSVVNTRPEFYWLTSYLETHLLRAVWYPTTVATLSFECKKVIKHFMRTTCDSLEGLPFKLHDFGARGVSSEESAGIGGAAHLVNFMEKIPSRRFAWRASSIKAKCAASRFPPPSTALLLAGVATASARPIAMCSRASRRA